MIDQKINEIFVKGRGFESLSWLNFLKWVKRGSFGAVLRLPSSFYVTLPKDNQLDGSINFWKYKKPSSGHVHKTFSR